MTARPPNTDSCVLKSHRLLAGDTCTAPNGSAVQVKSSPGTPPRARDLRRDRQPVSPLAACAQARFARMCNN